MKKIFVLLVFLNVLNSCSSGSDDATPVIPITPTNPINQGRDVPPPRSYTTYTSQNSVTLNGVIDNTNNQYQGPGTYKVGFVFRTGSATNTVDQQVIVVDSNVEYQYLDREYFKTNITGLTPNTKYFYTCYTENGTYKKDDWEEFTTSENPCTYAQNNYISINGTWQNVSPTIESSPICCSDGNFGIRFGSWPNIYEVNFNELNDGYPRTGQFFGVDYEFDITDYNQEVVKSSNQVLIGDESTPATKLFVNNNGTTLTVIFCNTTLRSGTVLNGKVSVAIP
ncbi:hypothetical protein EQG63_04390 [Flavobacterium amnicola]|uniref:Fibronectin type-III domain-containing protein n=1 Tax=Flavobacterium amnicola TaxID=2506422 RepID=A0A4Q1K7E7_9FLAO|nr:fibronectin type III domain-containing protein [Flavobacterium amnicola]RXR21184.1 hypothetical protein EQG63_04390 [Flavobacterium amnicola]